MFDIFMEVFILTIQQCKYILEIVRQGSFNEAAKVLFVAQTSISSAVKAIENELNIKIFERSNKGVDLTKEGAEFVRYARQLVGQAEFISDRYLVPKKINKISVSAQHYDFVAEIFGKFMMENSEGDFDYCLREVETFNVIDDVAKSFSDIGIMAIKSSDRELMERFLTGKHLEFHELFRTPYHAYIRKGHPLSHMEKVDFSDLAAYPYITYEQGEHSASMFTEEFSDKISCAKNVRITDRATLMNFLLVTDCYTIGTGTLNHSKLSGDNMLAIPLKSSGEYVIGYVVRNDKKLRSHAQSFIESLTDFFLDFSK